MSDFLQFVDRVPTLPNRKKITHADSSVEYATVEYADEPVTIGTPLNKANFNKINAVLGYNILQYTQRQSGLQMVTLTDGDYLKDQIITNDSGLAIKNVSSGESSLYRINVSSSRINLGTFVQQIEMPDGVKKFTIKATNSSYSSDLQGTNDLSGAWTTVANFSTTAQEITRNYKYYRTTQTADRTTKYQIYNIYFDHLITEFNYDTSIDEDKQILNVYVNTQTQGTFNTLNNKTIDTLLQNDHYYELMYDEPNDRFIAEEVRNAN